MTASTPLARRRRASARLALYASVALLAAGAAVFWAWLGNLGPRVEVFDWQAIDYESHPAVEMLSRYIEVDTQMPGGDPPAGAEHLASYLRAAGVPVTIERVGDLDVLLWAVLEGDDPQAVVLHHHVDVELVEHLERWLYPPFEATIEGPWLYGRGAFDMKSVAVAQLEAFLRLARRSAETGRRPARSVIYLATSGEETGSDLGMRWLLRRHPELVERFWVVLTEGGAVEGRDQGDVKYWGTEFAQKRNLRVTVCGDRRERLVGLRRELIAEGRPLDGLVVSPELEVFLHHYAPTRDRGDWRRLLADPHALARNPAAFSRLPVYLQSLFRNEVLTQPVEETDGGWQLELSVQLVPGADPQAALAELLPQWRLHGLAVAVHDEGAASRGSPPDHPVMAAIGEVLAAHYPGMPSGPIYLPWTITDARFLRAHEVEAYGFSPFMVLTPEVLNLASQRTVNERIALPGFVEGVEIYDELLERIAGPAP